MINTFYFFKKKSFINSLLCFFIVFGIAFSVESCEKKKQLKITKPNNTAEVKRLTIIADRYLDDLQQFDTAYYYYKKIIVLCNPDVDTADYVDALTAIATIQQYSGDYISSEATATEAIPYLKHLKKTRFAANIYNQLGILYMETYDNDNAILYFRKVLKLKIRKPQIYLEFCLQKNTLLKKDS